MAEPHESALLRQVADEYQKLGYKVSIGPRGALLPEPLRELQYEYDLLAERADEHVVVEIKSSRTLTSAPDIHVIAERLRAYPGWRLDLRVFEPSSPLPSRERLAERAMMSRALVSQGYLEPALLMAWAALESAIRLLANRFEGEVQLRIPALIDTLNAEGILSDEQRTLARFGYSARSAIVHGTDFDHLNGELVHTVAKLAERLSRTEFTPVAQMVDWFFENYEDPAQAVPFETGEGGYQYYAGGPYDARQELADHFEMADEEEIAEATALVEVEATDWVKRGQYP
jgi:hypothetical protein